MCQSNIIIPVQETFQVGYQMDTQQAIPLPYQLNRRVDIKKVILELFQLISQVKIQEKIQVGIP